MWDGGEKSIFLSLLPSQGTHHFQGSHTGKVSPAGQGFLDEITARGGVALVARSVEDVVQANI